MTFTKRHLLVLIILFSNTQKSLSDSSFKVCDAGYNYHAGLCFENCQPPLINSLFFCRHFCDNGSSFNELTGTCSPNVFAFLTVQLANFRKISFPKYCQPESYTKPYTQDGPFDFTMIFSADTQFAVKSDNSECSNDDTNCITRDSILDNIDNINAMDNLLENFGGNQVNGIWPTNSRLLAGEGERITRPEGLVINGDLTNYFHPWQINLFSNIYERVKLDSNRDNFDLYPGLGNHEFVENLQDCAWDSDITYLRDGRNGCSLASSRYLRAALSCDTISNFRKNRIESFDNSSLAYSWNIGNWHFVQLHLYPGYVSPIGNIASSLEWLRDDLIRATDRGQWIVLNFHDTSDYFRIDEPDFLDAIKNTNIVLVVSGHRHNRWGVRNNSPGGVNVTDFVQIESGSPSFKRFALIRFTNNYFNFAIIKREGDKPSYEDINSRKHMRTFYPADIIN